MRPNQFPALSIAVALLAAPTSSMLGAAEWQVQQSGGCSDTACTPCCTIQAAVGHCVGGDSVLIFDGVYTETVDLSQMSSLGDITLLSAGGIDTVFISPTSGHAIHTSVDIPGMVNLQNLNLSSLDEITALFTADGDITVLGLVTSGGVSDGLNIASLSGSISISGSVANNNSGRGMELEAAVAISVVGAQASNNVNSGLRATAVGANASIDLADVTANGNSADGLNLETTGDITVELCAANGNDSRGVDATATGNVTVIGCTVENNAQQGLALRADQSITVDACDANNNLTRPGIEISGLQGGTADDITITRTVANGNGAAGSEAGIKVTDVAGTIQIVSVEASGNSQWGFDLRNQGNIYVQSAAATANADIGFILDVRGGAVVMRQVTAVGHGQTGIEIHGLDPGDVASVLVETTEVRDNAQQGLDLAHLDPAGAHRVQCANFINNGLNGLIVRGEAGALLTAENNWWAAVDGPSGVGSGSGDAIDPGPAIVDFDPWLAGSFEFTAPCAQIFADGFESGTTAAWSRVVP